MNYINRIDKVIRIPKFRSVTSKKAIQPVVLILFIIIISLIGCSKYNHFSLTEGIAHFSFEYPSSYYLESTRLEEKPWDYTRIRLLSKDEEFPLAHLAQIIVDIENISTRYSNIDEEIEQLISWATSQGYRDFCLLERFDVEIAGVEGKGITYSYSSRLESTGVGFRDVIPPAITRNIYFEYNDKIWYISITASEDYAETAKADFEHIIETFKFIE